MHNTAYLGTYLGWYGAVPRYRWIVRLLTVLVCCVPREAKAELTVTFASRTYVKWVRVSFDFCFPSFLRPSCAFGDWRAVSSKIRHIIAMRSMHELVEVYSS